MLDVHIQMEEVRALSRLSDAGAYAERLLTAVALRGEFESGVIRRKAFREALGIGESTLSTWLQSGRIPRTAALAYVLWLAARKLSAELRQRDEQAAESFVVRCRDGFAVVDPPSADGGKAIARLFAYGIETEEEARDTAVRRSPRFRKVLNDGSEALWTFVVRMTRH